MSRQQHFARYDSNPWLCFCLMLLIAWVPIPLGSNRALSFGFMQFVTFSLLSLWSMHRLITPQYIDKFNVRINIVLALFLLSLIYQLFQAAPIPLELISILSPSAFNLYSEVQTILGKESFSLSLDIGVTLRELQKSATYVAIFFLVLTLVSSRKRLKQLTLLLVLVGFAEALFGLIDNFFDGMLFRIPFLNAQGAIHAVTGTYENRNLFGGFLEMVIPLSATLVMLQISKDKTQFKSWRLSLLAVSQWLLSARVWPFLFLATMVTALLYSKSRGANLSMLSAFLIVGGLAIVSRQSNTQKIRRLAIFTIPILIGALLGGGHLLSRLEKDGFDNMRHEHRQLAYKVIDDYPVFGIGAGTWAQVYPAYENPENYSRRILARVHNDYLELLAEQGIIGFLIFGSAVLIALGTMIEAYLKRRDPFMRAVLFGCITATVSILIHSFVDFNLQIPANAAWFSVILAMGLIASRMPHDA